MFTCSYGFRIVALKILEKSNRLSQFLGQAGLQTLLDALKSSK